MKASIQTNSQDPSDRRLAEAILLNFAKGYTISTKVMGNYIFSSANINLKDAHDLFAKFEHESLGFHGFATLDMH
jgi:hypothetical protein